LVIIWPFKGKNVGGTPFYSWVERAKAIRAHNHRNWKMGVFNAVYPPNEGVYASAVFVVHLCGLARLGKRIGLID